jgi:hypothetical protein
MANTGVKDPHYDLISVLYHALEGGHTLDQYIQDAEGNGDSELAQYFRETQQQYRQLAERGKGLLKTKLG